MDSMYQFDAERFRLGRICPRAHNWAKTEFSLRYVKDGNCVECSKEKSRRQVEQGLHSAHVARRRATHGRKSRSKNGLPYKFIEEHGFSRRHAKVIAEMYAAGMEPDAIRESLWLRDSLLQKAGKLPTVARLVMDEQRRYWRENPEAKAAHDRWWDKYKYSWRYKCDPLFRLHECQRNSEKKARNRGNHTVKISKKEIQARYAEFNHRCAFCGSDDRIVIEHVVARSKGGPHAVGNILPACHRCNTNKTNHEVESWYRRQPFFSELRWRKICRVLGWQRSSVGQLALL